MRNKHRDIIYGERRKVLDQADLKANILDMVHQEITSLVETYTSTPNADDWDLEAIHMALRAILPPSTVYAPPALHGLSRDELLGVIIDYADSTYEEHERKFTPDAMRQLERMVMLQVIDRLWVNHLTAVDDLRQGIGLRAYGQRDPLVEYRSEAYNMFQSLLADIRHDVSHTIYHYEVTVQREPPKPPARAMQTNREPVEATKEPVRAGQKIGRNDPCPCGSGKKFKRCHGR